MKRTLGIRALLVIIALSAACTPGMFEDVGSDPHPPTLGISALILYVAPPPEPPPPVESVTAGTTAPAPGRSITWDSGGFTMASGEKFQLGLVYSDAGGDISKIRLRDRDGALSVDLIPTDQTYFPGTSGILLGPEDGVALTGVIGRHRLELWAEDSHESRSEKIEFVVTITLAI